MDQIAIISDIHGNKAALDAVLDNIHSRNISRIYCLGDVSVKCTHTDYVIDTLRKECQVILKGNCDEVISAQDAVTRSYWTRVKIGEERAGFLRNLPIMYEFYLSGHFVRLFHASPFGLSYIFNPMFSNKNSVNSKYELTNPMDLFANTSFIGKAKDDLVPDIIGYGHIHTPNVFRFKNKTIFNCGSVGVPIEMGNPADVADETNKFSTLASYTILEGVLDSKVLSGFSINTVRVPYDIRSEIIDLQNSDMPGKEKCILSLKTASSSF